MYGMKGEEINNIQNSHQNTPFPSDSILDAVPTFSPKRQYLGILCPTTPATTGPENTNTWFRIENSCCTGRPDVCQCLVVQESTDNKSTTHVAFWIKIIFSCEVIHAYMPRKLGCNRTCGRVLCQAARALSAGIEWRHCNLKLGKHSWQKSMYVYLSDWSGEDKK